MVTMPVDWFDVGGRGIPPGGPPRAWRAPRSRACTGRGRLPPHRVVPSVQWWDCAERDDDDNIPEKEYRRVCRDLMGVLMPGFPKADVEKIIQVPCVWPTAGGRRGTEWRRVTSATEVMIGVRDRRDALGNGRQRPKTRWGSVCVSADAQARLIVMGPPLFCSPICKKVG